VNKRLEDGSALCANCYRKEYSRFELCADCGLVKPVCVRGESQESVCSQCYAKGRYHRVKEECFKCGKVKAVSTRTESGKAICGWCSNKGKYARRPCAKCGKIKKMYVPKKPGDLVCDQCKKSSGNRNKPEMNGNRRSFSY
jgi:hypothetical protein